MHRFEKIIFLTAALALGCEEDDASSGTNMDAGAKLDAGDGAVGMDAGDASGGGGLGGFACTSWTAPAGDKCGGSHCQETLSDIKTNASASSVCKQDEEFAQFCSLGAVDITEKCAQSSFSGGASAIKQCTAGMLPSFSSGCIDCYVDSALCAAQNCFVECVGDSKTDKCDLCRVAKGCIGQFYTCAGYKNPLP